MRSAPIIVTIDGPAASGKTTVSRILARKRGWSWVSTGAFYRGLAFVALQKNISLDDEHQLATLCHDPSWRVEMADERTKVILGGEDVTNGIYGEEVGAAASKVSRFPKVRENLLKAQRDCGTGVAGLIAEGRDCGTVVFPDAQIKVFLTAESHNRAERRAKEEGRRVEDTIKAQVIRDAQDTTRTAAPLQIPENAHVLDTSKLTIADVTSALDEIITKELALNGLDH